MVEEKAVSHSRHVSLGKAATGEFAKQGDPLQSPKQPCPQCGSTQLYKDGLRYTIQGPIQRFLCRACGFRFSNPTRNSDVKVSVSSQSFKQSNARENFLQSDVFQGELPGEPLVKNLSLKVRENVGSHASSEQTILEKPLYAFPDYSRECRVCATNKGAKNLTTAMEQKTIAGEIQSEEVKGLIIQFMAWLEKEGYAKETKYPSNLKRIARLGANLLDPENVKQVLGKHNIKNGAKMQYAYAYSAFLKMLKMSWDPPKLKQEETLPFIPDEKELDQLIAACRSRRMAAYLQCLKETFADPGEALRLRWVDISGNVITINRPVKGHLPRRIEVQNRLIAMLNALPKTSELIFPTSYANMFGCYSSIRKRAAELQKNPRLLSIELRTFRHWGGTMLAHYTNGNVLTVQRMLGHKRIENTMKYISMINFKDDQFEVATATTVEEAKKILSAGFNYVTEKNGIMLFRRPKRFSAYVS